MKGFVCDRCGKVESGLPDDWLLADVRLDDMEQNAFVKIELVGRLPKPDLCNQCKLQLAKMIIEASAKEK